MSRNEIESIIANLFPGESRWFAYCLLGGIAVALTWRFVAAPRRRAVVEPPLTATELACVRNRQAPVVVALAQLRAADRTDSAPVQLDTDAITRVVRTHYVGRPSYTVSELTVTLAGELDALEERLAARGYLRSDTDRWRMRLGAAPVTACAVGGAVSGLVLAVQHRASAALITGIPAAGLDHGDLRGTSPLVRRSRYPRGPEAARGRA